MGDITAGFDIKRDLLIFGRWLNLPPSLYFTPLHTFAFSKVSTFKLLINPLSFIDKMRFSLALALPLALSVAGMLIGSATGNMI